MSHSVRIDYESIAIECRSICEAAASQLCKIDSLLEKIDAGSSRLLNDETAALRKQLAARKAALQEKIDNVVSLSQIQAQKGVVYAASSGNSRAIIETARSLEREVNQMSGRDIYAYEALVNDMRKAAERVENTAIECKNICEVAEGQLSKIDSLLQEIDKGSSRLLNTETTEMRKCLVAHKSALREKIDNLESLSKKQAQKDVIYAAIAGNERTRIEAAVRDLQREVKQMSDEVNQLFGRDIYAYDALLNDMLKTKTAEHAETMRLRAAGTAVYDKTFSENLKSVEDEVLKGYIYLAWLDGGNAGKDFSELKEIAGQKMKASIESHITAEKKNILSGIEAEMREAKLDEQTIQNALKSDGGDETANIARIREKATAEIIGESIRKKTLKAVLDCIEKQGFIVDKKNIKHQKDSDEVVMVAQKASGETAEFRVMLNGKFIYKFHGYEGQACQEDIAPFMRDLEEVYGVKPAKIEEIWRNPDKLSTQHYQTQKHKENRR